MSTLSAAASCGCRLLPRRRRGTFPVPSASSSAAASALAPLRRRLSDSRAATTITQGKIRRKKSGDDDGQQDSPLPPLVLHVSSGLGPQSLVSRASSDLLSRLQFRHELLSHELWSDALISYNVSHMAAKMRLLKGQGSPEDEEIFMPIHRMAEELNAASLLVVSAPMWNFSFPYVLKQYIDIAVQPGINFTEVPIPSGAERDPSLAPTRPVTWDKHLVLVTSRGGRYGDVNPRDHFGPYLRDVFGMLGFTRVQELTMEGALNTPKDRLLERAAADAQVIAANINGEFARER